MAKKLEITLLKSPIGRKPIQRNNLKGLGLRRIRHTVVREDTPCIRGMITRVRDMVHVEECNDAT